MCRRTCPECGSKKHSEGFGMAGAYLVCDRCLTGLAWRADPDAAPLGLSDDEAEAWALARRGVLPGAEAKNPRDDDLWRAPSSEPSPIGAAGGAEAALSAPDDPNPNPPGAAS